MCPAIALLGEIGTDHDGFPPTPVIAASPDVFLDASLWLVKVIHWPPMKAQQPAAPTGHCQWCWLCAGEWQTHRRHRHGSGLWWRGDWFR